MNVFPTAADPVRVGAHDDGGSSVLSPDAALLSAVTGDSYRSGSDSGVSDTGGASAGGAGPVPTTGRAMAGLVDPVSTTLLFAGRDRASWVASLCQRAREPDAPVVPRGREFGTLRARHAAD
jgi:hypothetical protein